MFGIRERAKRNRRSLNSEAIVIFERAIDVRPLDVEETLEVTAEFRKLTEGLRVDQDMMTNWINEGRE